MTPQEAEIIKDVFTKLKAMGPSATDAEAAGLVEAQLAAAGLQFGRLDVKTEIRLLLELGDGLSQALGIVN